MTVTSEFSFIDLGRKVDMETNIIISDLHASNLSPTANKKLVFHDYRKQNSFLFLFAKLT